MLPVVAVGVVGFLVLSHRVDALALGDDAARGLGVPVRSTRIVAVVLAVLLSAAAVTIAGPIGFVGLCAPHSSDRSRGPSPPCTDPGRS